MTVPYGIHYIDINIMYTQGALKLQEEEVNEIKPRWLQ